MSVLFCCDCVTESISVLRTARQKNIPPRKTRDGIVSADSAPVIALQKVYPYSGQRGRKYPASENPRRDCQRGLRAWWKRVDSDHRSKDATDLQSAPFGHSGTLPHIKFPLPETFLPCGSAKYIKMRHWPHIDNILFVQSTGAGGRTRTPDLLITNQLLYQLSYTSIKHRTKPTFKLLDYYITTASVCQVFF